VIQTTAARPSAAAGCSVSDVFETDRPDVTNSPLAVPRGSLQAEDGVTWTGEQRSDFLDGAETMLRVGAADCTELALQLPSYFFAMNGEASSGFSDVAVAFKRQLPDLYGFVTAAAAGLIFPSGSTAVSDGGYDPYIQGSWSRDIADGWSAAGCSRSRGSLAIRRAIQPFNQPSKLDEILRPRPHRSWSTSAIIQTICARLR